MWVCAQKHISAACHTHTACVCTRERHGHLGVPASSGRARPSDQRVLGVPVTGFQTHSTGVIRGPIGTETDPSVQSTEEPGSLLLSVPSHTL